MSPLEIKLALARVGHNVTTFAAQFDISYNIVSSTINNRRNDKRTIEAFNSLGIDIGRRSRSRETVLDRMVKK